MSAAELASLRLFLLTALRARELGATEATLLRDARAEGFATLTEPQLKAELRAIADRAWITPYQPALGAQRWRITALGGSALDEQQA